MTRAIKWIIEAKRVIRFGFVGVVATVVYAGASLAGVAMGLSPVPASIAGQATSAIVSYLGHTHFTFGVHPGRREFMWRFLVIALATFGLNATVTGLLTYALGVSHEVSIAVVAVLIPATNYICNRYWVFLRGLTANDSKNQNSR